MRRSESRQRAPVVGVSTLVGALSLVGPVSMAHADGTLVTHLSFADAFDTSHPIRGKDSVAFHYGVHVRALFGPHAFEGKTPLRLGPFVQYAVVPSARHSYSAGLSYLLHGHPHSDHGLWSIMQLTASAGPGILSMHGERERFGPRARIDLGIPASTEGFLNGPCVSLFVDGAYFPSRSRRSLDDIAIGVAVDPISLTSSIIVGLTQPGWGHAFL